jgi:HEAT repeat protein
MKVPERSDDREDPHDRRRRAAVAGHTGDTAVARAALADANASVRATALAALARAGALTATVLAAALADPDPTVRRRACEVATTLDAGDAVLRRLTDDDPGVVETAAWALGEIAEHHALPPTAIAGLSGVATDHDDPLAREAAVAALGAIGDPAGLAAILNGTTDKPAIRRRAVLALAPFDGPDVDAAVERCTHDRDWQVRDAAALIRRADE